jgi:hypothetical protein
MKRELGLDGWALSICFLFLLILFFFIPFLSAERGRADLGKMIAVGQKEGGLKCYEIELLVGFVNL